MNTSTVSSKYQVVIPLEIRKLLNIKPGQKLKFIYYNKRLEIIPIIGIKNLRGIFPNIDTNIEREGDRL